MDVQYACHRIRVEYIQCSRRRLATVCGMQITSNVCTRNTCNSSQAFCSVAANLATQMKMGGQLLLENRRRMDPRVWIKKKRTKESMAEMKVQWDSSVVPRIYLVHD